jgi:hypothetical protein
MRLISCRECQRASACKKLKADEDVGQRHILRDRRRSTTACPACWAMGTNEVKLCTVRKKIFCNGPTGAAKAGQKSLVMARRAKEGPLSYVLLESLMASVSTVGRGHPSLISLMLANEKLAGVMNTRTKEGTHEKGGEGGSH